MQPGAILKLVAITNRTSPITPSLIFLLSGITIAILYLPLAHQPPGPRRTVLKTLPVFLFAMAAISQGQPAYLSAALLLCAIGDSALSRPGKSAFLYGLSAFALAHILYTLLFLGLSGQPLWAAFASAPLFAITMLGLALSTELWLTPYTAGLRWPVRVYILLIGAMALAALTLPINLLIVALGAAVFVLSDLLLAIGKFRASGTRSRQKTLHRAVWITYITAQALILWGFMGP